jgi:hypothetical protein
VGCYKGIGVAMLVQQLADESLKSVGCVITPMALAHYYGAGCLTQPFMAQYGATQSCEMGLTVYDVRSATTPERSRHE